MGLYGSVIRLIQSSYNHAQFYRLIQSGYTHLYRETTRSLSMARWFQENHSILSVPNINMGMLE